MATLIETIRAREEAFPRVISPSELEHFVLTTVETALEMALNAVDNGTDWTGDNSVRDIVDPAQIIAQLKEDFTESVQQYWPEPVEYAKTGGPIDDWPTITRADVAKAHARLLTDDVQRSALDEDNEDIQSLMDRDRE